MRRRLPPGSGRNGVTDVSGDWIGVVVVVLTILASHAWFNRELRAVQRELHSDVSDLRERMAKLEGALDGFIAGFRSKGEQNN